MGSGFKWVVSFKVRLKDSYLPYLMEKGKPIVRTTRDKKGRFSKTGKSYYHKKGGGAVERELIFRHGFATNRPLTEAQVKEEMEVGGVFRKRIEKNISFQATYEGFDSVEFGKDEFYGIKMYIPPKKK